MSLNKMSQEVRGAVRSFSYFIASGTHYMLKGVDYLDLFGEEPSAIEEAFAIFCNVLELYENDRVANFTHAQKRATDYLRNYCDPSFTISPPLADWEVHLHAPTFVLMNGN